MCIREHPVKAPSAVHHDAESSVCTFSPTILDPMDQPFDPTPPARGNHQQQMQPEAQSTVPKPKLPTKQETALYEWMVIEKFSDLLGKNEDGTYDYSRVAIAARKTWEWALDQGLVTPLDPRALSELKKIGDEYLSSMLLGVFIILANRYEQPSHVIMRVISKVLSPCFCRQYCGPSCPTSKDDPSLCGREDGSCAHHTLPCVSELYGLGCDGMCGCHHVREHWEAILDVSTIDRLAIAALGFNTHGARQSNVFKFLLYSKNDWIRPKVVCSDSRRYHGRGRGRGQRSNVEGRTVLERERIGNPLGWLVTNLLRDAQLRFDLPYTNETSHGIN
jgi:hypothetical protein